VVNFEKKFLAERGDATVFHYSATLCAFERPLRFCVKLKIEHYEESGFGELVSLVI
jgi:hypothetical protein